MIVYDVEVLKGPDEVEGGWNNPEGMGFGTAVAYSYSDDVYYFYVTPQKADLIAALRHQSPVISFNGIKFDNRVLLGNDSDQGEALWNNIDLLLLVVRGKFGVKDVAEAEEDFGAPAVHDGSIGLDGLAEGTLGMGKIGHGAKAPLLIRDGDWSGVYQYNLHDVRLTRLLFDFARKYGYLIDRKGNKIKIDLSFLRSMRI